MAKYYRDEQRRAKARVRRRRAAGADSPTFMADAQVPIPHGPEGHQQALGRLDRGSASTMLLRLQRGQGNAHTSRMIRDAQQTARPAGLIARSPESDTLGSNTAVAMKDPRRGHGPVKPGQANYSRLLLAETGHLVEDPKVLEHIKSQMFRQVPLDVTGFEPQLKYLAAKKEQNINLRDDWNSSQSFYKHYDSVQELYASRGKQVEGTRAEMEQKVQGHNAWTQRANGFIMSIGRLDSMMAMLGIPGANYDVMAGKVTQGLAEAKEVGEAASMDEKTAHGADMPVPPANTTVLDAAARSSGAVRNLNNAYLGYQRNALKLRAQEINKEGDSARGELAQINEVKAFVKQVGGTVDMAMSFMAGAPAAVGNATAFVQKGEAKINAYRNKKALMKGEEQVHSSTFMTADDKGNLIVRDVQTGMDYDPSTNEHSGSPAGDGFSLPVTPGAALEKIVDFVYAADVKRLTSILNQIETRVGNVKATDELVEIAKNAKEFRAALMTFAEVMTELQHQMEQRRNDYLKFGLKLDEFARKSGDMRKQGHGLGKNQEKFALVMVATSQIREVLSIGDGANQDEAASKAALRSYWKEKADQRHDMSLKLTQGEVDALTAMFDGTGKFQVALKTLHKLFDGVEGGAKDLFGSQVIAPGGAAGGSY